MASRRKIIKIGVSAASGFLVSGFRFPYISDSVETPHPVQITNNSGYHWFGYYDKLQAEPSGRYVLGMEVSFEGRSPTRDDEVTIGMIDLKDNNRWIELGKSRSWGWQQGCMLQWIPGSSEEVIWNDRGDGRFVSRILNIRTGVVRTLPRPVYALSPDGTWAIGTEFSRIQNLRPGYGYAGIDDPYGTVKAPGDIGLYRIDLKTGEATFLISIAQIAAIPHQGKSVEDNFHWFNHLLINTNGSRFTFLNRWRKEGNARLPGSGSYLTRMITASSEGKDIFVIDPSGYTSHFVWSDPGHICAWTRPEGEKDGFYLLEDKTGTYKPVGKGIMTLNGHNTYVPGKNNEWILCDTYPQGPDRLQELYLFHIPENRKVVIGKYNSPVSYTGEWRCDLHPKCTPDGKSVIFDSTHGGNGRQIYKIDIEALCQ